MRWQYFCLKCNTERVGLLDRPHGIDGYSWACPECKSHEIGSRPAEVAEGVRDMDGPAIDS